MNRSPSQIAEEKGKTMVPSIPLVIFGIYGFIVHGFGAELYTYTYLPILIAVLSFISFLTVLGEKWDLLSGESSNSLSKASFTYLICASIAWLSCVAQLRGSVA